MCAMADRENTNHMAVVVKLIDDSPSSPASGQLADSIEPQRFADPGGVVSQRSVHEFQDRRGDLLREPIESAPRWSGQFDQPTLSQPGELSSSSDDRIPP